MVNGVNVDRRSDAWDYPGKCVQLDRSDASAPLGKGAVQRSNGLGDLRPGRTYTKRYFYPVEKHATHGKQAPMPAGRLRRGDNPYSLRLGAAPGEAKKSLSDAKMADAAAADTPDNTASAMELAGRQVVSKAEVRDEFRLTHPMLLDSRNADEQSGMYASGLRRIERIAALTRQRTAARERDERQSQGNLYADLMRE